MDADRRMDAAADTVKPHIGQYTHSVSSSRCDLVDGSGGCTFIGSSTEDGQFPIATDGLENTWNPTPSADLQPTKSRLNPDYLPHPDSQGSHALTTVKSTTHTTQIPTSSLSVPEVATAPTLASVGAVEAAPNSNGSNLGSGAVAGIAIATLIIGAALAFLAAFFFFKRRNKQQETNVNGTGYTSYADSTPELILMQQKGVGGLGGRHSPYVQVSQTAMPAPVVQKSAEEQVLALLPPLAHDSDVQARITSLFETMHRHVETYYRDVHASITPSMEPELAKFGAGEVDMADLLQDCSSPTTALKHALVAYVLGITAPHEGGNVFPGELVGLGSQSDPALSSASSLHRRLTIYLYLHKPSPSRHAQSSLREAAEHFSLTFFPWAHPTSSDQAKDEDLAGIIGEALEMQVWLFGQQEAYAFEWESTGRRGVAVSPGVVKGQEGERVLEGVVLGV